MPKTLYGSKDVAFPFVANTTLAAACVLFVAVYYFPPSFLRGTDPVWLILISFVIYLLALVALVITFVLRSKLNELLQVNQKRIFVTSTVVLVLYSLLMTVVVISLATAMDL